MTDFENIDKLMEEIYKLKQAHKLLEDIWVSFRPYELRDILGKSLGGQKLAWRIEEYFGFDDSE